MNEAEFPSEIELLGGIVNDLDNMGNRWRSDRVRDTSVESLAAHRAVYMAGIYVNVFRMYHTYYEVGDIPPTTNALPSLHLLAMRTLGLERN